MPSEWLTRSNTQRTDTGKGEIKGEKWRIWLAIVVERLNLGLVSLKWPPTEQYLLGHCRAQEASKQMWTPVVPTSQGICFLSCFILRYNMQVVWNYAGTSRNLGLFWFQKRTCFWPHQKTTSSWVGHVLFFVLWTKLAATGEGLRPHVSWFIQQKKGGKYHFC